jgi:hypothetical protein
VPDKKKTRRDGWGGPRGQAWGQWGQGNGDDSAADQNTAEEEECEAPKTVQLLTHGIGFDRYVGNRHPRLRRTLLIRV